MNHKPDILSAHLERYEGLDKLVLLVCSSEIHYSYSFTISDIEVIDENICSFIFNGKKYFKNNKNNCIAIYFYEILQSMHKEEGDGNK